MIETLLITLVILAITNIVIGLKKKVSLDIKPQLKEIEESILKFDTTLERTEKSIKDEFQRNRSETNDISKINRDELTKSLSLFGDQFSKNVKELNNLLNEKFAVQNKQQVEFNKQTTDSTKENRDELSKSLKSFEENFSENIPAMRTLNPLTKERLKRFMKQTHMHGDPAGPWGLKQKKLSKCIRKDELQLLGHLTK